MEEVVPAHRASKVSAATTRLLCFSTGWGTQDGDFCEIYGRNTSCTGHSGLGIFYGVLEAVVLFVTMGWIRGDSSPLVFPTADCSGFPSVIEFGPDQWFVELDASFLCRCDFAPIEAFVQNSALGVNLSDVRINVGMQTT